MTVLRTGVPHSFDIFEEAISALCLEFGEELGIAADTHQQCIETISVQALPIARSPILDPNDEGIHSNEFAEFYDVPIQFEDIDVSIIRVQVNKGIMPILNAAELFVAETIKVTDESIVTRNVFILSQYILSTLRTSKRSIITKSKETGELIKHTTTVDYNQTIKLPLEFDLSVEDEGRRKSDAAAAFCIEFSFVMNLEVSNLSECINGIIEMSQKIDFQELAKASADGA